MASPSASASGASSGPGAPLVSAYTRASTASQANDSCKEISVDNLTNTDNNSSPVDSTATKKSFFANELGKGCIDRMNATASSFWTGTQSCGTIAMYFARKALENLTFSDIKGRATDNGDLKWNSAAKAAEGEEGAVADVDAEGAGDATTPSAKESQTVVRAKIVANYAAEILGTAVKAICYLPLALLAATTTAIMAVLTPLAAGLNGFRGPIIAIALLATAAVVIAAMAGLPIVPALGFLTIHATTHAITWTTKDVMILLASLSLGVSTITMIAFVATRVIDKRKTANDVFAEVMLTIEGVNEKRNTLNIKGFKFTGKSKKELVTENTKLIKLEREWEGYKLAATNRINTLTDSSSVSDALTQMYESELDDVTEAHAQINHIILEIQIAKDDVEHAIRALDPTLGVEEDSNMANTKAALGILNLINATQQDSGFDAISGQRQRTTADIGGGNIPERQPDEGPSVLHTNTFSDNTPDLNACSNACSDLEQFAANTSHKDE